MRKLLLLILLLSIPIAYMLLLPPKSPEERIATARTHAEEEWSQHFGKAVFLRIIKEEKILELWLQERDSRRWKCHKSYSIAAMSGTLGPKTAEGDKQAPEGFYRVYPHSMNPQSKFHLAFNIGYPNLYDRRLGRTGSFIMVHGGWRSVGCFAMTDAGIEEIYTLVNEAFKAGVPNIPVQIYPFRMSAGRMLQEKENEHYAFWQHLLPGWQHTESRQEPYPDRDNS